MFLVFCFLFLFTIDTSFSLTESIDLFGEVNSADLILNDIWIDNSRLINGIQYGVNVENPE